MNERAFEVDPVVKEVTVKCPQEEAFRIFTEGMGGWWPADRYSIGQERVVECGMQPRPAGLLYELQDDGRRSVWGTIQVWEPPVRVQFSWHPGREPESAQTVEVTFRTAEQGTRVRLEHRGWERLGEQAQEVRDGYEGGWEHVFRECFVQAANRKGSGK